MPQKHESGCNLVPAGSAKPWDPGKGLHQPEKECLFLFPTGPPRGRAFVAVNPLTEGAWP